MIADGSNADECGACCTETLKQCMERVDPKYYGECYMGLKLCSSICYPEGRK